MDLSREQARIDAVYISHCSPDAAYVWLELNKPREGEKIGVFDSEHHREIVEYLLLRRKNTLIDLGLSRFAHSERALRTVFRRGGSGIRCAALANPVTGKDDIGSLGGWMEEPDWKALIERQNLAELTSLASNPALNDDQLENMITRQGPFFDLSDGPYAQILVALGKNTRLSTPRNDSFMDGWSEYRYNSVFNAAWELSLTLPVEQAWARILLDLLAKAEPPVGFDGLQEAIERWRIDRPLKPEEKKYWYNYDISSYLRCRLADLLKADDELLNSDDLAIRISFYRRFPPYRYKDWPKFLERDGENFADAVLENLELWHDEESRKQLSDIAWECPDPNSDMMLPNKYRALEERFREEHPEWFREEDEEYSNDEGAVVRRIEKTINSMSERLDQVIDSMHPKESGDNLGERITYEVEQVRDDLVDIKESLDRKDNEVAGEIRDVYLPRIEQIVNVLMGMHTTKQNSETPQWVWWVIGALLVALLVK